MRSISNLVIAAVLAAGVPGAAVSAQAADESRHCFFSSQFKNWRAADEKTLYIRVGVNRYFRLDLAASCRTALWPDATMITVFRGSNLVCSALDWDVKVSQRVNGIPQACMVSKMTELTEAEAAALPRKVKP